MTALSFVLLFALAAVDDPTPQFHQDFRNKSLGDLNMKVEKPAHASLVKAEPEGLRITIPTGKQYTDAVGVTAPTPIKGDFEITAAYEIIEATRPTGGGFGVGIELYIRAKSRSQEGLGFYRLTRDSGADSYSCSQMSTNEKGQRGPVRGSGQGDKDFPAHGKFGQLRMTRIGSKVILSAADDLGNDFQPKYEMDFVPDDLVMLRIGANPGGVPESDRRAPFGSARHAGRFQKRRNRKGHRKKALSYVSGQRPGHTPNLAVGAGITGRNFAGDRRRFSFVKRQAQQKEGRDLGRRNRADSRETAAHCGEMSRLRQET